ncbi:hypothetical protein VTN77DRAFT_4684 [Rasamsonia byssochlamydoides]|uniref:uncharacterized protein n=1 Tax=Rasamsonia byssochlamydoides TaxID=89139 RepID=UPI0037449662
MSEVQRFGLVKSLVQIEAKLVNANIWTYGSLYYRDDYLGGWDITKSALSNDSRQTVHSKFVVGPITERSFWVDERREIDLDRGPWRTVEEYLRAVVNREIACIRANATRKGIIDWKSVYAAPLFHQARFPSVFDSDDPYPWGAVQPQLPEDLDALSPTEKEAAKAELDRIRLKKFYELGSRKFNPDMFKAMDAMRDDDDPTAFIFHIIGQSSTDGPIPSESFSSRSMKNGTGSLKREVQAWADVYNQFGRLRTEIMGKEDGWVSHEEFEDALRRFNSHKETLERLGRQLNAVARM